MMHTVTLAAPDDFDGWRAAVRGLVQVGVDAADVDWHVAGEAGGLFGGTPAPPPTEAAFTVPRQFVDLARRVVCHRDAERFALLHALLARLRDQPALLADTADPLVHRITALDQAVRRDVHKMRAFVRFREMPAQPDDADEHFAAWFEPDHHIVRLNAPFFMRRFTNMHWSILTPEQCAHWDLEALTYTAGVARSEAPGGDPLETTWTTYYAAIFNPARLKVKAMTSEMPQKYWKNLPEAALISDLIAGATQRMTTMIAAGGGSLSELRAEASACTRCPLYAPATQTVFGEGPADAALMLVGEQPGDSEDLAGRPFVGPAGQLLDRALRDAGVDRTRAYVTNAVKHFKFELRGKRRIHSKPMTPEIDACRTWLDRERAALRPRVTVALGATAARALTGKTLTIGKVRGQPMAHADGGELWITVHPSFLLRIEDAAAAADEYARFIEDLRKVQARVAALS